MNNVSFIKKASLIFLLLVGLINETKLNAQVEQGEEEMKILDGCREAKKLITYYQFEKALLLLDACQELMPNDENVLSDIALCHFKLGRNIKAKTVYNRILELNPENLNALVQLATIYTREQRLETALETYNKLLELDNTNSYYYTKAALLQYNLNKHSEAIQLYEKALVLNPEDLETATSLSNLYIRLKQYELAEYRIEKSLLIDSLNLRLLRTKAKLFYIQDQYLKVLEIGEKLVAQADTTDFTRRIVGLAAYHEKNYPKVIEFFVPLLKQEEEEHLLHYYLGIAYQKMKQWAESEVSFKKAISAGIATHIDDYFKQLGYVYEQKNQLKDAIHHYKKAHYYSKESLLLYQLARTSETYYKDKKIALRYYKEFLKKDNKKYPDFREYAAYKVNELTEQLHMSRK